MTNSNSGRPPPEISSANHSAKRRIPYQLESSSTHIKKHRLVSKSNTLIRNPSPNWSSHTSNSFEAFRLSSRSRRKKRGGKSSSAASSRRWVFSSRDYSNYKVHIRNKKRHESKDGGPLLHCLVAHDKVVVVSYNILGVENASKHLDLYSNIPHRFLEWDRRKLLIREEIYNYNASILCFQEVDRFSDLNDLFQNDGYKGVYKARTGEAHDGCAVFWKDKLFTLLHQEDIEFQQFDLRNNVAQLCVLEVKNELESDTCTLTKSCLFLSNSDAIHHSSVVQHILHLAFKTPSTRNKRFLVGNIHVLFNPNRGDIKLGQVRLFLDKAYKLSQEWGSIPVIISGDLNSVPQSAIYEFLASSELDIQLHNRRNMSGQLEVPSNCRVFRSQIDDEASIPISVSRQWRYGWSKEELRLATGAEGVTHLQHDLKLCSAYVAVPGNYRTRDDIGEPLATSYHSKFMGTVDYIWHTKELVPVRVLETLPNDILRRTRGLPSEKLGSDHLALVCELAFVNNDDMS